MNGVFTKMACWSEVEGPGVRNGRGEESQTEQGGSAGTGRSGDSSSVVNPLGRVGMRCWSYK